MRAAWSFLTVFGGSQAPHRGVTRWFPAVGVLIGLSVGGVWWAARLVFPPLLAAVLAVVADLVVTGMLHLDGVADVADGCLSTVPRERRRQIMAAPDVGAFGVVAVVAVLLVRAAALAGTRPSPLALAGVWCLSRTVMATVPALVDYVGGGLASAFVDDRAGTALTSAGGLVATLALVAAGVAPEPVRSVTVPVMTVPVITVTSGVLGASAVVALAQRRLGGYTGDVLGAAGVLTETAALLALVAR